MMSPTTKGPEYIQLADSNDNDPNGEDSFDDQIEIEMFPLKSASVYDRSNYMTMSPQSTNAELSPESSFGTRNIRTNREHARSISSNGGGGNHEVPTSTMPPPMTRVKSLLNRVRGGSFVMPPSPFNPIAQLKRLSSKFSTVSSASSGKRERSFVLGRVPQTPWNPDGIPYENIRIQLLFDIAGYLMMYGAPLYRVQHRLMKLSGLFEIPVSAFFLPTDLMISVGDNTVSPNRTFFLAIPSALNMYKLERIDKIARNVTSLMEGDRQNIESTASLSPSVIDRENRAFYEIEKQLADVVYDTDAFSAPWVRLLLAQFTSTFLLLICFKGDFAEAFITFFLSGLVHLLNNLINYLQLQQAAPIFVSFLVSFIASMVQTPVLWKWANAAGLCDTYVVIASLIAFMPGSQFALGMLEFSSLPLASLNRLFLAFMRSFQIGYGMVMYFCIILIIVSRPWAPDLLPCCFPPCKLIYLMVSVLHQTKCLFSIYGDLISLFP